MNIPVNIVSNLPMFILVSTLLVSLRTSSSNQEYTNIEAEQCNGTVSGTLVYGDGEVIRVEINGKDPVSSAVITQFSFPKFAPLNADQESYAGENGITVEDDGHNILLFPGGNSGQQVIHLFNYTSKSTSTINVYCQPVSLAYRPADQRVDDAIVGHCTLNTTVMRVPYFGLGVRGGKWTDVSITGLYSNRLDTTNLTNTVILQYESDYDAFATKLYFADSSTLHEINLGYQGVDTYPLPNGNQVYRLVPAGNSSFPVLRVIFYNGDNSRYSHQYFFPSETRFISLFFDTDFVAYDSFDLSYLVMFVNHNTLSIIRQDRSSKQFSLNITLDDPIQCENMVIEPNVHYLICLADGGLHPVIINVIEPITSKVIPVFDSQIIRIGMLAKDTFYLLTAEQEMLFYVVVNSEILYLGRYGLRHGIDYVVTSATNDIICSNAVSKPDGVRTARNSLGIIIVVSCVSFLLLILLMVRLVAVFMAARAKYWAPSRQNITLKTSKHVDHDSQETTQEDRVEITCDDHDGDQDDDDASTDVLESVQGSRHSVSTVSFIVQTDPLAENANNERLLHNNTEETQAINDSRTIEPNPYVMPFESSAKCDNIEMQVFEQNSNQPVPFVEGKSVVMPVTTTKEHQSSPVSDVERRKS